jgi:hypothetical protein
MKQQTAVEFVMEKYEKFINSENGSGEAYFYDQLVKDIEQAKAMEKEQIMNAYNAGESDGDHYEDSSLIYYIDTFKIK